MFGFFRASPYTDPQLGTFVRRRGRWIATFTLPPHGEVELRVAGDRKGPSAEALRLVRALPGHYAALKPNIADALFEHYEPGRDAWDAGELEGMLESFPLLKSATDVWENVRAVRIDVDPSRRAFPVEIQLTATWDFEHTLGVRLLDGEFVELCGSTAP